MGVGISGSRVGALTLALLAAAALCVGLVANAGAAKLVGKDGKVYACYKGKSKGAVRLVTKKGKCHKGEKKVSWDVAGPAGEAGQSGENGSGGENGSTGESGSAGTSTKGLEQKVQSLTSKVTSLESVLKGITNTELLGALSKLQGISGAQLRETVASLADVKALCTQATALTNQANALGATFGGIELGGVIPSLLKLVVPAAPSPLAAFGC